MLRRVVYTSIATKPMDRRELLDLLHDARGFNKIDGITGLLLHDWGQFLQIIEGPENAIDDLLERLNNDKRHGPTKFFVSDGLAKTEWFYDGKLVSKNRFDELRELDLMITQANEFNEHSAE